MCVKEASHIVTSSEGLSHPNLSGCASSLFCRERQTGNACADGENFFKETELWFCSVMSSSGELLTSCLGSMKHHFEYREPFQDDLLHQNNRHKQRNIFWFPLFSDPMCAPIPHVPLLNTRGNKYVGVNMYYLFVKLRVRSDT